MMVYIAVISVVAISEDIDDFGYHVVAVFIHEAKAVSDDIIACGSDCIADPACAGATTAARYRIAVPFQGEGSDSDGGSQQYSSEQQVRYAQNAFVHVLLLCKK